MNDLFSHALNFLKEGKLIRSWSLGLFLHPALPIIFILKTQEFLRHLQWIPGIDHYRKLIRKLILIGIGEGLRMRTVMNSLRMISDCTGIDIVPGEEISLVIEEDLIVVDVTVEKWNF